MRCARWGPAKATAGSIEIRVCGPQSLLPEDATLDGCIVSQDLDAALDGVDAVMMLRLQRERMDEGLIASLDDYHRDYGLTSARLKRAAADAVVLHPGPDQPRHRDHRRGRRRTAVADPQAGRQRRARRGWRCWKRCWRVRSSSGFRWALSNSFDSRRSSVRSAARRLTIRAADAAQLQKLPPLGG